MKLSRNCKRTHGVTLLELSMVILVLLALMTLLFIAARAWMRGSDKSASIITIRNTQQAVRAYANMYQRNPGDTIDNLPSLIFGPDKFIEEDPSTTDHPASSAGVIYTISDPTVIPLIGTLYLTTNDPWYMPDLTDIDEW
jgi:type II secretory pathway pseudopilin PulG